MDPLRLSADAEQIKRWRLAAEKQGTTLEKWIASAADIAADAAFQIPAPSTTVMKLDGDLKARVVQALADAIQILGAATAEGVGMEHIRRKIEVGTNIYLAPPDFGPVRRALWMAAESQSKKN